MENVGAAFLLTALAGLSTGIGSLIALLSKKTNKAFLAFSLGLSAGVMIYISLAELMSEAQKTLSAIYGAKDGALYTFLAFFAGILLIALIDKLIPSEGNPHETKSVERMRDGEAGKSKLLRTGIMTALAIAIHNFPEGFATFAAALQSPGLAIPTAVAIAIHNIPEGISVSVPIYHATGSRKKAFLYSFMSGLSEPLGAVLGYFVLRPFMSDTLNALVFAVVAGIMVFISVDELLPSAREYGEHHLSIYGFVCGMAVMAASLWAFI